jgi:hypothetical protein
MFERWEMDAVCTASVIGRFSCDITLPYQAPLAQHLAAWDGMDSLGYADRTHLRLCWNPMPVCCVSDGTAPPATSCGAATTRREQGAHVEPKLAMLNSGAISSARPAKLD